MNPAVCSDCASPWRVSDEKPTCPRCGGLPRGEGRAKAPPKRGVSDRLRALQEHKKAQDVIATEVPSVEAAPLTNTMTATQPLTEPSEDAKVQAFAKDLAAQEEVGKPKEFLVRPRRSAVTPAIPYEVAPLLEAASILEARARFITAFWTLMGVLSFAVGFGAPVGTALHLQVTDPQGAAIALVCGVVGGAIGYFFGRSIAVWFRAAANLILCLARIEENTRAK